MDFLLENEGKPVPDLSTVSASSSSQPSGGAEAAGEEDDEELEALKAVYGKKAGNDAQALAAAAAADAEPKVRLPAEFPKPHLITCFLCAEYQVLRMW